MWPSLSCRWGQILEQGDYKLKQRLYLSEQTDGSSPSFPNTLTVANVEVVKRRVAAAEHLTFNEEERSSFVKRVKSIIHPGEVNKIREFEASPELFVTHTDAPELFVWNSDTQPHRKTGPSMDPEKEGATDHSVPDLVLVGHEENAEFALAVHRERFHVASGGKDQNVLIWNIADHDGGKLWSGRVSDEHGRPAKGALSPRARGGDGVGARSGDFGGAPTLAPALTFVGHADTVEDVAFHPSSALELCSVGDDSALIFWDGRAGTGPVCKVGEAHESDVHSVDWSLLSEHAVVTGGADSIVKLWDRRKLGAMGADCVVWSSPTGLHTDGITTVQWCPDQEGVFASAGEDGYLNVFDRNRIGAEQTPEAKKIGPPELLFQHAGHRSSLADFHWNPCDPWTIASVSSGDGGNTLQIWRMSDLIYRPEADALAELEKHKHEICGMKKPTEEGEGGSEGDDKENGGGDAMVE